MQTADERRDVDRSRLERAILLSSDLSSRSVGGSAFDARWKNKRAELGAETIAAASGMNQPRAPFSIHGTEFVRIIIREKGGRAQCEFLQRLGRIVVRRVRHGRRGRVGIFITKRHSSQVAARPAAGIARRPDALIPDGGPIPKSDPL